MIHNKMNTSKVPRHCPKCGGNILLFNDCEGWYGQCLQCSFVQYLDVVYKVTSKVDAYKTSVAI